MTVRDVTNVLFVGAAVMHNGRILLVRQAKGHPLEGQWTVPWGRVDPGESPCAAATREVWEEGGVRAEVKGLLGVQELPAPQHGCVALVYLCAHVSGAPEPQDTETDAAEYFAPFDLQRIAVEPWSKWLAHRLFGGTCTVTYADQTNPLQSDGSFL